MSLKILGAVGAVVIVAIAIIAVVGRNSDEASASDTDGAFVTQMAPHHEAAIEMAMIAQKRAEHPQIKQLADDIVAAQTSEIKTLGQIHERLYSEPLSAGDHGTLGLPDDQMGMTMDPGTLVDAKPFDVAFIDMMIPHHQGAIRMAQVELDHGSDQQTKDLATAVIAAQSKEIEEMNAWREQWYGAPSPAGGVPSADEMSGSMDTGNSMDQMGN